MDRSKRENGVERGKEHSQSKGTPCSGCCDGCCRKRRAPHQDGSTTAPATEQAEQLKPSDQGASNPNERRVKRWTSKRHKEI